MGVEGMIASYEQNRKMRNSKLKKRKPLFGQENTDSRKIKLKTFSVETTTLYIETLKIKRKSKFYRDIKILGAVLTFLALVIFYLNYFIFN